MKKEKKEKHFIQRPAYPGGPKAMREFLRHNLQYPEEARLNGIEGTVAIRYEIDFKGNVTDVQILTSLGHGCDEEAIRLAKLLKFDVPVARGLKVSFHNTLKVHFKAPKPSPQQGMHYNYVPSAPKKKKTEEGKPETGTGTGYSYTVTFNS